MSHFQRALDHLVTTYGHLDLFRMVTYDAGACSLGNATAVRERNLHYLFGLKGTQPTPVSRRIDSRPDSGCI